MLYNPHTPRKLRLASAHLSDFESAEARQMGRALRYAFDRGIASQMCNCAGTRSHLERPESPFQLTVRSIQLTDSYGR